MLGETLTAVQLAAVTQILSNQNLNIDSIKRLTGFYYRKEEFRVLASNCQ
jgi:phosphoserine phosphatase